MSEILVSQKYVIITAEGLENFFLFQCIECIKLELGYQVFLSAMKNKDSEEKLQPKLSIVRVIDGFVDFCKFEIKIYETDKTYRIIRDSN